MTSDPVMTRRQLNRALLARQMLLTREKTTALEAIERLVGLQAQVAKPPFIGLWTRVHGFTREDLLSLLSKRRAVRATTMRGTIHVMTAKDFAALRGSLQPGLTAGALAVLGARAAGVDIDRVVTSAREFFEEQPRPFGDLRPALVKKFPTLNDRAMGYLVRTHLPLVMVPSEDEWGFAAAAAFTCADSWIRTSIGTDTKPHGLVRRYLAAFGPATAADAQAWSGLKGLSGIFDELRPKLRTFRDERGRELFDLPDAPRPDDDLPAPVRYLPEFDNIILSHVDRSRIVDDEHRPKLVTKNLQVRATFLVDGFVAGTWTVERKKTSATMIVQPFTKLSRAVQQDLQREGQLLLEFAERDAKTRDVRVKN